ncbi:MAG TPA: tRNA-dihydrouridine synthase family protein [archaeon]|nr:tRNA-dihydrouridine synthase family protein [archaeon]
MNKIGSLKIQEGAFLAPMADYTNVTFRTLCKEYGAALVYTELVSVKGLIHKNKKTPKLLKVSDSEKPVFLQLFGNDPEDFEKAINFVEKNYSENFAGYDLNAGCSVPKAKKGKYGSYLLNYPKLIGNIIKKMKKATNKPVTVKMRLGLNEETFLDCAKEAEKSDADAICLHARFGEDGYSGKANWLKIYELKDEINVPIIGNGDIISAEKALEMKKQTSCDFVMVGRASMGNAFIFKQITEGLLKKKISKRNLNDKIIEAKRFVELSKNSNLEINNIKGYFISWVRGEKNAPKLRNEIVMAKSFEEIEKVIEKI